MGSGKSKVGRLLAERMAAGFVDTDDVVEELAGRSISAIFDEDGEAGFRRLETEAIAAALEGPAGVLALGGGAATRDDNWEMLKAAGALTVYLRATPTVILSRVRDAASRPLLAGLDRQGRLRRISELLDAREPHYLRAELVVDSDNSRTKHEMADMLFELVRAYRAARKPPQ